jgi:hypothetical protein
MIMQRGDIFLCETNSFQFYLILFSLHLIQGQLCRRKSSILLAPDVGNGLNYPCATQFKNDQNTNVITSNPITLDDMGDGFVSHRISNHDERMCGGVRGTMLMPTTTLVEEWTGQEGVEPQDKANSIDLFSGFLDSGGRFAFTNESVHYHHWLDFCLSDGYSCHGCVKQVSLQENVPKSVPSFSSVVPSQAHVFSKSAATSSCCTQAVSIAYLEEPIRKKVCHLCHRHAKKKSEKQQRLLTEVKKVPEYIKKNLLTNNDVENDVLVFDGGDCDNPPIQLKSYSILQNMCWKKRYQPAPPLGAVP